MAATLDTTLVTRHLVASFMTIGQELSPLVHKSMCVKFVHWAENVSVARMDAKQIPWQPPKVDRWLIADVPVRMYLSCTSQLYRHIFGGFRYVGWSVILLPEGAVTPLQTMCSYPPLNKVQWPSSHKVSVVAVSAVVSICNFGYRRWAVEMQVPP